MQPLRILSVLLVVLSVIGANGVGCSLASASDRIALVIGNNDYKRLPPLQNAANDASAIAASLEAMGWEVILRLNATQRDMGRAIETFEGRLATADASLVFYAGHGVQARGENWLIPADANVESEVDLKYESVSARDILEAMKRSGTPLNIVILDACRDNPLRQSARSASRGLAVPALPQGIKGTAVMFSAAPGETAEDGPAGGNGVFTGALLNTLNEPGLKLEEVFKRTARRVSELTASRQRPWFNSSVYGDFYFNDAARGAAEPSAPPAASPRPKEADGSQLEIVFWQSIQDSDQPSLFESYLTQYPDGAFAALALAKLALLGYTAQIPPPAGVRSDTPAGALQSRDEPVVNTERPPVVARLLPVEAAPTSDADRARAEAWLSDERDELRRKLSIFIKKTKTNVTPSFQIRYIWKAQIIEVTSRGYIVEIVYEASDERKGLGRDGGKEKFLMRLDHTALEFVEKLP